MTSLARWSAGLIVAAALATPSLAHADDDEDIGTGKVIAVELRPYRMVHEFAVSVGVLPLDALYTGFSLGGSYTLHLSDIWAWEAIDFHYSANVDTGLDVTVNGHRGAGHAPQARSAYSSRQPQTAPDVSALRDEIRRMVIE